MKKIANEANEARAQMNMYVLCLSGDSHNSEEGGSAALSGVVSGGFDSCSLIFSYVGSEIRM